MQVKEERDGATHANPIDVEKAKVMQSFAHLLQAKVQPALHRRFFADFFRTHFPLLCHVPFQVKEESGKEEEAEGKEKDSDADDDEDEDQEEEEEEDESIRRETRKARKEAELEEMVRVVTSRPVCPRTLWWAVRLIRPSSFPYRFAACR